MDYLAAKYGLSSYKVDIIVASYGYFPLILHKKECCMGMIDTRFF